jgi:hypothetical protein
MNMRRWAHARLCAGTLTLRFFQRKFAQHWFALYNVAFDAPGLLSGPPLSSGTPGSRRCSG